MRASNWSLFLAVFTLLALLPFSHGVAAPLAFQDKDVIAGLKHEKLRVMINLAPYLDQMKKLAPAEKKSELTKALSKTLTGQMAKKRFQAQSSADVEFVLISKLDEYGRPDFASMKPVGKSKATRQKDGVRISELEWNEAVTK